ncbi:MAG TPA: iron uptake transporter permease EfeU [Dehalococcoidia bacterium]|jgi:high-affinity iron transporter
MVPALVIGLREGVEASLIVGIIAAFLKRNGRSDALPIVMLGVVAAGLLCLAVGIALDLVERSLPQRPQEQLETVVGAIAVLIVSYMVVWMRKHSREMRGSLEAGAREALAKGSVAALVGMAFIAVLREGFETAIFLVAVFQSSGNADASGAGAVIGLVLAVAIGYGIYRGGVRINLARFFKVTGFVLVLVAAGLVASALHTAWEAGWVTVLQGQALDLGWLLKPGTVTSALVTGMLGIQPRPTVLETAGWLLYLIPASLFIFWPQGPRIPRVSNPAKSPAGEAA